MKSEIKLSETILEVIDTNEWSKSEIYEQNGKYCIELEKYSPLGEDFIVTIWFNGTDEDFVNNVCKFYCEFEPQEHAAELISMRGEYGIPNDIRKLMDDAEDIDSMLWQLAEDLLFTFK